MKKGLQLIVMLLLVVLCITGCIPGQHEGVGSTPEKQPAAPEHEERTVESRIEFLKTHFAENRADLEIIACTVLQEMETYSSHYINPAAPSPIIEYFEKNSSEIRKIFPDWSHLTIDTDICIFWYGRYVDNGVLSDVNLVYCEEPGLEGKDPFVFIPLDEHWYIMVEYFGY